MVEGKKNKKNKVEVIPISISVVTVLSGSSITKEVFKNNGESSTTRKVESKEILERREVEQQLVNIGEEPRYLEATEILEKQLKMFFDGKDRPLPTETFKSVLTLSIYFLLTAEAVGKLPKSNEMQKFFEIILPSNQAARSVATLIRNKHTVDGKAEPISTKHLKKYGWRSSSIYSVLEAWQYYFKNCEKTPPQVRKFLREDVKNFLTKKKHITETHSLSVSLNLVCGFKD